MKIATWLKHGKRRQVTYRDVVKSKIVCETTRRKVRGHEIEVEKITKRRVKQVIGVEAIARDGGKVWRATAANKADAVAALEAQL